MTIHDFTNLNDCFVGYYANNLVTTFFLFIYLTIWLSAYQIDF